MEEDGRKLKLDRVNLRTDSSKPDDLQYPEKRLERERERVHLFEDRTFAKSAIKFDRPPFCQNNMCLRVGPCQR